MRGFVLALLAAAACGDSGTTAAVDAGLADAAPAKACTIYPQSGCGTGETCALRCDGAASAQLCRSADTTGTQGMLCDTSTDCAANHICIGEGDLRVCRQFCQGSGDCVAPGGQCIALQDVVCGGVQVPPAVPAKFCTED